MRHLQGKRVLITGGARGIGLCTAEQFARAGCRVIITDIDQGALDSAVTSLARQGYEVDAHVVDVTKQRAVQALARRVLQGGDLDILINNAGIGYSGELVETSLATWKKLVDVNLWGPLYHVYAFLPHFTERRAGHIVNVSTGQVFFQLPTWGAYSAVKAALAVFSELLHYELKKFDVQVTTVYPFMVNTGFYRDIPGETWGSRLSMRLVPYYSQSPERVGSIIFRAVARGKKVEPVSIINAVGRWSRFVPGATGIINRATLMFLGKSPQELLSGLQEHISAKSA